MSAERGLRRYKTERFMLHWHPKTSALSSNRQMDFCSDSGTGDVCTRSFPTKSSPGLCAKCIKLASLTAGSAEYDEWKACYQLISLESMPFFMSAYPPSEDHTVTEDVSAPGTRSRDSRHEKHIVVQNQASNLEQKE